jgi:bilirubin oxidase
MKFVVGRLRSRDTSTHPSELSLPRPTRIARPQVTRQLSLNEVMSEYPGFDGPAMAMLGTMDAAGNPVAEHWSNPISENPRPGVPEIWEFHNFTEDAHPVHVHQVQFEVVDRQSMDGSEARQPEASETGRKDTVISYPGEITRVKLQFDIKGLFVWHCHILEHEDNEMMRPIIVDEP